MLLFEIPSVLLAFCHLSMLLMAKVKTGFPSDMSEYSISIFR